MSYKAILRNRYGFTKELSMPGNSPQDQIDIPAISEVPAAWIDGKSLLDRLVIKRIRFILDSVEEEYQDLVEGFPPTTRARILMGFTAYYEEEREEIEALTPCPEPHHYRRHIDTRPLS